VVLSPETNTRMQEPKMEITLETIYKKIISLERNVNNIKKVLYQDPELRDDFIRRIKKIDSEQIIMVKDFGERYGLK
jgi:hypothetical protein